MKRFVDFVQALTAIAALWTVVLLFIAEAPITGDPITDDGARLYAALCSSCHGAKGQGLHGPQLAGRVVEMFPNIEDQLAVVADGRNGMPAFGERLTAEELGAVVEFTRTRLGD